MAAKSALDVLESLTLEQVRTDIAAVDEQIAKLDAKRDSLRVLERAIDYRDNGKPKRQPGGRRKKAAEAATGSAAAGPSEQAASGGRQPSPEMVALRVRLVNILRTRGPMPCGDLSRHASADYGTVDRALRGDPRFEKRESGWIVLPGH